MIPVVTFFNNKGGVGKTSLVYHLACMFADLGTRVLVADLDPQANLTSLFFDDDVIEELWDPRQERTLYDPIAQMIDHEGGLGDAHIEPIWRNLSALVGTPRLASLEGELAESWSKCLEGKPAPFKVMKAFSDVLQDGADRARAEVILVDVGPSLGAINRAALVASDFVVTPLGADLFSLAGIQNLGRWLAETRKGWQLRLGVTQMPLPQGAMTPAGYIVSQHVERAGRPAKAYQKWMARIPSIYADSMLRQVSATDDPLLDPNCLGVVKHFRSLMPLAQEARKPIFHLRAADGAIGSHAVAAQQAYAEFRALADRVAGATWRPVPPASRAASG